MRALISVYDKTNLSDFARRLTEIGFEIISSGGTSDFLKENSIKHITVESVTGFQEMLDGRVKTLHPKIHGGILADLDKPEHVNDLKLNSIEPINLVVCNLYPFKDKPSIELIDVGGPTMVRAAAKNYKHVGIVVDPGDYGPVLDELGNDKILSDATKLKLAAKAFNHTANYDKEIAKWFNLQVSNHKPDLVDDESSRFTFDDEIELKLVKSNLELRYGENPHQFGAFYRRQGQTTWLDEATLHSGKKLSYLNIFDADAAWKLVNELSQINENRPYGVAIIKHANACGAAISDNLEDAYTKAMSADPVSAFGGIVAINGNVNVNLAEVILDNPQADVLIAQSYDKDALELIKSKRKVLRVISATKPMGTTVEFRTVDNGFLVQEPDILDSLQGGTWTVVTDTLPDEKGWADAALAYVVCARTTSNAIVYANEFQIVAVGAGQQSRVMSAEIAAMKADGKAKGGAAASDAFFPFRDGVDAIAQAGITTIIQPGGSIRDAEIIEAANEHKIAMILTGQRHFKH